MKKTIFLIAFMMLWAPLAAAEQAKEGAGDVFEIRIGGGWYGIRQSGNNIAGEYEYLKSSPAGAFELEWDPLPHRFVIDSYYLNDKDYFGETDYAFRDVVLLNAYTRSLFHNLNHYVLGPDDPATTSIVFTDQNPGADYGIENRLNRAFLRLKTPDFPFHLYADVRTIDREGTIQQRFLDANGLNQLSLVSRAREIDWDTREYRVGVNSHLGPIKADYSHTEKEFKSSGERVLLDGAPHNLVPDLSSSWDTVKVHTSYSGKFVLSGTYTTGDKSNEDSRTNAEFTNSAGDLMFMPVTSVILSIRYRHAEQDVENPDTITATGLGVLQVRDSISSTKDSVSGVLRYRVTDRLTVRGEYLGETTERDRGPFGTTLTLSTAPTRTGPAYWVLPESTTKGTGKVGFTYRLMNRANFRADYSRTSVDNPAYPTDPDTAQSARASLSWMPAARFSTMLAYTMVRESRDELTAPTGGGSRDAARDHAVVSATTLIGSRTSLTLAYGYVQNKVEQTLSFQDGGNGLAFAPDVPYTDTAHTGSATLAVSPAEGASLVASASRSYARGNYKLGSAVPNTGLAVTSLTKLRIVDTVYSAGVEMELSRFMTGEVRYQHQEYDDQINDAEDGRARLVLATLSLNW